MPITDCVGVYLDTDTCHFHFNNLNLNNTVYFKSIDDFFASDCEIKYAGFHVPFDSRDTAWLDTIDQIYGQVNKIFVFCSELHAHTVQQLIDLDRPKFVFFVCGKINFQFKFAKVYRWLDWFVTSVHFYKVIQPNLLADKLIHNQPKRFFFDILLGCQRTHRDFVYNFILHNDLTHKVVITYFRFWNVDLRETEHIFETEGLEFLEESSYTHSVHQVKYYGYKMNLSQIVPIQIYNDCYFTIITETNAVNEFNFFTEKTVKPLLAKRLFVVIAGQGFLQTLRSYGFRTFDTVIDESYDLEPDSNKRWTMALEQVKYLTTIDSQVVNEKIQDIVQHNHDIILGYQWYNDLAVKLLAEIQQDIVHTIVH